MPASAMVSTKLASSTVSPASARARRIPENGNENVLKQQNVQVQYNIIDVKLIYGHSHKRNCLCNLLQFNIQLSESSIQDIQ